MLKIRLQRFGKRGQPHFRVVLTDSRHGTRSGKFLEILGWYNARTHAADLKRERIAARMKEGAQASDTMHNLLIRHGVITGVKRDVASRKRKTKGESKTEETASASVAAPVPKEEKAAEPLPPQSAEDNAAQEKA